MRNRWFIHLMTLAALLLLAGCGSATAPVATADPLPELAEEAAAPAAPPELDAAAESTFAFPADGVGKHLEERLGPPRQAPLPPVPFVAEPKPRPPTRLERAFEPSPPAPEMATTPRLLPSEKPRTVKERSPGDTPPLAADLSPTFPSALHFAAGLPARAVSPDPGYLAPRGPGGNELPSITSDPTVDASRQGVISISSPLRDQPAPPLNLSLPDPFENARVARLRNLPSEVDEPAAPTQRPPLPPLPAK